MAPLRQATTGSRAPLSDDVDRHAAGDALHAPEPARRRAAVHALAAHAGTVSLRLERLRVEPESSVRETLFTSLESDDGDTVVAGMIELMRGDDAELRAGAVEVLQNHPQALAPHLAALLEDPDSDVRIMALDVLRDLHHERTPEWLLQVLECETQPNVLGTALDRLMEVGDARALPVLDRLSARIDDDPFLRFAIDMVRRRIEDGPHA